MRYFSLLVATSLIAVSGTAVAVDFGVQGTVWPIAEPDVRMIIFKDMMKIDQEKLRNQVADDAKSFISRLPKRDFTSAEKTTKSLIDVSVELSQDIKVPVKDDKGNYSWQYLARKGDRVNPLKTKRLGQLLYFFNGSDPAQVKILKDLLEAEPLLIMPIEAGAGDLNETSKYFDRPIFYANDYMINQFHVQYLPTIAYQGINQNSALIESIAYAMPTTAENILSDWETWPKRDKYFGDKIKSLAPSDNKTNKVPNASSK